jgi:hypothetical protein
MSQSSGEARVDALSPPGDAPQALPGAGRSGARAGRANAARTDDEGLPLGLVVEETSVEELVRRVARLERRIRVQLYALVAIAIAGLAFFFDGLLVEDVIVRQKLMESKELTLLDNDGNARLFLRMYSRVPVLQIMDSNGKPRMSLGLRFDDTPFLDLSDRSGRTRATFEMTEEDAPALRLFDQNGHTTFNIN